MTNAENGRDASESTTDFPLSRRTVLAAVGAAGAVGGAGLVTANGGASEGMDGGNLATFDVRIENVSDGTTLQTSASGDLAEQAVPLSPGAYAVHRRDEPIFSGGEPERDNGLEEIAEDGMPGKLAQHLAERGAVSESGAFTTPVGTSGPAPIGPGGAYEFQVAVEPPAGYLSLVTMFVPSNDLFYTLGGPGGLALFDGDDPVSGDVTEHVGLWDAGTEVNEEPGVGENQVQRQRAAGVGLVERGTVASIEDVNGYEYPAVEDVIAVTVEPTDGTGGN